MRLAVVSPFVDRRHGTERALAEFLERFACSLALKFTCTLNGLMILTGGALSTRLTYSAHIFWHEVPAVPGPHIVAYLWWFLANHVQRFWDSRFRKLKFL